MLNRLTIRLFVAIFVLASMLGAFRSWAAMSPDSPTTKHRNIDYLPNISLVDQNNHKLSLASLKGRPVLVGFIHTSCQGPCELMTAKMRVIADDLEPSFPSRVTMVSVTTDPDEDHPKQLAEYAKAHGAQGAGWIYLTGRSDRITQVLNIYGVPAGEPEDMTSHVFELWLIGPDGRVLHRYEGNGAQIKAATVVSDIRSADARLAN
jgi:protein SCO1/2